MLAQTIIQHLPSFAVRLIVWQREFGRHDLPWQGGDAYCVWLSEIMLQQTQVITVIPYFLRFVASFPNIAALAAATEEQVLEHWSGLGYYARGRNLHKAARLIVEKYHSEFPNDFAKIIELPGIGRSTAAAICALAFHQRCAILDGNVKRVLARYCGIAGWTGDKKIEAMLWQHAEDLLPKQEVAIYIQAQMDMGATLCTRSKPKCAQCPVQKDCVAYQSKRVAELPTPRPRKTVPERHATFLLLRHGNEIYLEKRAATGIWGGLWSLPQLDDGGELPEEYVLRNGYDLGERTELAAFTHIFTHFKLHITPVVFNVAHRSLRVQQTDSVWLNVEGAVQAAIPTPVRMMLAQLKHHD
ncbi:MAG: A/G-specific adenine glycosylase [Gallionella sp.]